MITWRQRDQLSIPQVIDARAAVSGDKTALHIADTAITFRGLAEQSVSYANGLTSLGVAQGDAVALLMDNTMAGVLGWLGCSRLGAVDIPVNTAYAGDFLRRTLHNTGAMVLLCDEHYLSAALPVAPAAGISTVVVRGAGPGALGQVRAAGMDAVPWDALTGNDTQRLAAAPRIGYLDPSSVIYTSGTTGASKGVTFSHNYLLSAAEQMASLFHVTEEDVYYGAMPLFHLAAKACGIVVPLIFGSSAVLDPKFSVSRTWKRVRETNATVVHMLGSMMVMLTKLPPSPDDATLPMRAIFGAPIPGTLHHQFEQRYHCQVSTCYALSEACLITRAEVGEEIPLNSAGRVNDALFEVRLVDDDEQDVPAGSVGEIAVRPKSPGVMFDGYWRNPDATVAQTRNLWFHTGDLGRIDADGWFYFEGRKKDALRRRGENVSGAELENAVREHPAINDLAAIGVPSEVLEDDIKIFVELIPGADADHQSILDFCIERLPFFMVPRYIEIVAPLPRNPVAKIEKYRLREAGLTAATWDATIKDFVRPRA